MWGSCDVISSGKECDVTRCLSVDTELFLSSVFKDGLVVHMCLCRFHWCESRPFFIWISYSTPFMQNKTNKQTVGEQCCLFLGPPCLQCHVWLDISNKFTIHSVLNNLVHELTFSDRRQISICIFCIKQTVHHCIMYFYGDFGDYFDWPLNESYITL